MILCGVRYLLAISLLLTPFSVLPSFFLIFDLPRDRIVRVRNNHSIHIIVQRHESQCTRSIRVTGFREGNVIIFSALDLCFEPFFVHKLVSITQPKVREIGLVMYSFSQ